jgi:hypothetical protein
VLGAPGPYTSELFTFGYLRPHSVIIHRTVWCANGLSGVTAEQRLFGATVDCTVPLTALQFAAEVRAEVRGAPDSEQYLSGAAPDCPVPPEVSAPMVDCVRTLTVGRRGWRTELSGAPIDSSHPPTVVLVVEGYKYPQPPPLQPSKHSSHSIQYKSKTQHSKTQIKATDPIKVPNSILVFRTCERIVLLCLCCSCCLVGFLLPHSCSLSDL